MSNKLEDLQSRLNQLSQKNSLIFAGLCCERVIPNYRAFMLQSSKSDSNPLKPILNQIWHQIDQDNNGLDVQALQQKCLSLAVDSDSNKSIFTGMATDAVIAIYETLGYMQDQDTNHITAVLQAITNSIDTYLHIVNAPGTGAYTHDKTLENWVKQSPLMQAEHQRQNEDLAYLLKQKKLSNNDIDELRRLSQQTGVHPVKRGLLLSR